MPAYRRSRPHLEESESTTHLGMTDSEDVLNPNRLIFVIAMWLLSRLVIVVAMQLIAPSIHTIPSTFPYPLPLDFTPGYVPTTGWELFSHWDGAWYRKIATSGYDYANDGQWHSVAFFPLFPVISRGLMTLGLPFEVAATLVNNLAFLGALIFLYRWVEERHGISAARWATAVLAWCPFSLFGTVIYTEGLFLLCTTAALQAFEKGQYLTAALWGVMSTAARGPGLALAPAFFLVAWRERRPAIAYITGIAVVGGMLLFCVYCGIRFGDPLAIFQVQGAWKHHSWLYIFKDFFKLKADAVTKVVMVFGGGYMLWCLRTKLSRVAVAYGFCSLALLLASGNLSSINRYAYGIVSLSIGLGVLLARHPRWGYALMGLFGIFLVRYAINFSWWRWVA